MLPSRRQVRETDCVTETLGYLECLEEEDKEQRLMSAKALHTTNRHHPFCSNLQAPGQTVTPGLEAGYKNMHVPGIGERGPNG